MSRWLRGKDEPITEPPIKLLSAAECRCTPRGRTLLLEGARSVYDLNVDCEKRLAKQRRRAWAAAADRARLLDPVRRLAGIRKLADLPVPKVEKAGVVQREGYRIEKLILRPEPGIHLPALLFVPEKAKPVQVVLYVHEKGKAAMPPPDASLNAVVLAVDLRGTGETQQTAQGKFGGRFGRDWVDVYTAYLLGRSYVGMRAEDILVCARYAATLGPAGQGGAVHLHAVGNVGVPALHAAALEPQLFASVKLTGTLVSWSNAVHCRFTQDQLVNAVHGALRAYDLPDLAATLRGKLTIEQPVDAMGRPVEAAP